MSERAQEAQQSFRTIFTGKYASDRNVVSVDKESHHALIIVKVDTRTELGESVALILEKTLRQSAIPDVSEAGNPDQAVLLQCGYFKEVGELFPTEFHIEKKRSKD